MWKCQWAQVANKPDTLIAAVSEMNPELFPNISTIFRILLVQPVTAAGVARSNFALKRIKTKLRSSTSEDSLNALLLLHVHRDIELNIEKLIEMFATKCPRRMLFTNPLDD